MNIKALIATLVLGSSSAALAQPVAQVSAGARFDLNGRWNAQVNVAAPVSYLGPAVRDHRFHDDRDSRSPSYYTTTSPGYVDSSQYQPAIRHQTLLGSNLRFDTTTKVIPVGHATGKFRAIRIDTNGPINITKIGIQYGHGQMLVVNNLDRTTRRGQPILIDLPGDCQAIKNIAVYSDNVQNPGWRWRNAGTFSVLGL